MLKIKSGIVLHVLHATARYSQLCTEFDNLYTQAEVFVNLIKTVLHVYPHVKHVWIVCKKHIFSGPILYWANIQSVSLLHDTRTDTLAT